MQVHITTPARGGARNGNRHTATRWASLLRASGHRVRVATDWTGERCDVLVALHARRSSAAIVRYREAKPSGALLVVLTGTDLYRDLPESYEARRSLDLATRVVVLQEDALRLLNAKVRAKTSVVYQSATPRVRRAAPRDRLRIAVVGHLREEKDPFRAAAALARLESASAIELVQIGDALSDAMRREAQALQRHDPRYRWLGGVTHPTAMRWIARSHLLVVSSLMEGGANVISEAARIGTPVLASRMSGNLGMLGRDYPGYFPLRNDAALARLIRQFAHDAAFRDLLKKALRSRRALFSPRAERASLLAALAATRH